MNFTLLKRSPLRQFGQGMTEYIIIVGVIAVAAIGVFGFLGDAIKDQTAGLTSEIAGNSGAANRTAAAAAATAATAASVGHNSLSNYDQNSQGNGAD